MNGKLSEFSVYVKAIIYLLFYNLNKCTFKSEGHHLFTPNINNERKSK